MSIAVVLGTRPEIIKLAPVIAELQPDTDIIHTGQHFDDAMSKVFFDLFALPEPTHNLGVGGTSRGAQIGETVKTLDGLFAENLPDVVVVQGDTNTTMGAAIAANARGIPIAHVEAGLRSYDRAMPEEHNRVVTDHIADLHLVPTPTSAENLAKEGITGEGVVVTGNTVVDAVQHLSGTLPPAGAQEPYAVATFHRPENVDDPTRLAQIVSQLGTLSIPVIFAVHPRTSAMADRHGIDLSVGTLDSRPPLGYLEFLGLLRSSSLVIGDSGGLQEEVSVMKKPMVVLRRSTERPEVIGTFCKLIEDPIKIGPAAEAWLAGNPHDLDTLADIRSPYGDGDAGARSAKEIQKLLT